MHDVIDTASSAASPPKAVRKFGVYRRMSQSEVPNSDHHHHHKNVETERRGRSKTFSHSSPKKMLEKRFSSWTDRCFVAKFAPPLRHLSEDRVLKLRSYHVTRWALSGVILVKNITYEKRVFVRYSLDGWKTYEDIEAQFMSADMANDEDVFQFRLDFPFRLPNGTRLELALAYETPDGTVYWDNNDGDNYVFGYSLLP